MRTEKFEVFSDEKDIRLDGDDVSNDDGKISQPFDPLKVRVETKNAQMDALIKRIKNNEIELSPKFQRRSDVWGEDRQSRLIESMLIKIPLPAFYVDATNDDKWLVIDGLQRLTAINRFVIEQSLSLSSLEFLMECQGKKFSELPRSFQRRIEETDIVIHQIKAGTPDDVKYIIFRRINTGGEPLSSQEIRHALNQGEFVSFIEELAESKEFIKATDNGVSPRRMDDQECVLRFMAFTMSPPEKYDGYDFDLFLNNIMKEGNTLPKNKIYEYGARFRRAMEVSRKIFGNKAFRKFNVHGKRYSVNKALFEAVSVNIGNLKHEHQELLIKKRNDVVERMRELIEEDKDFDSSISQGTGSIKKVRYRFSAVKTTLEEIINAD